MLLIGHNPGIAEFAQRLAIAPPANPRFEDYPTGATTVFRFFRDAWRDVGWGEGEVADDEVEPTQVAERAIPFAARRCSSSSS